MKMEVGGITVKAEPMDFHDDFSYHVKTEDGCAVVVKQEPDDDDDEEEESLAEDGKLQETLLRKVLCDLDNISEGSSDDSDCDNKPVRVPVKRNGRAKVGKVKIKKEPMLEEPMLEEPSTISNSNGEQNEGPDSSSIVVSNNAANILLKAAKGIRSGQDADTIKIIFDVSGKLKEWRVEKPVGSSLPAANLGKLLMFANMLRNPDSSEAISVHGVASGSSPSSANASTGTSPPPKRAKCEPVDVEPEGVVDGDFQGYKCKICKKEYLNRRGMTSHMKIHHLALSGLPGSSLSYNQPRASLPDQVRSLLPAATYTSSEKSPSSAATSSAAKPRPVYMVSSETASKLAAKCGKANSNSRLAGASSNVNADSLSTHASKSISADALRAVAGRNTKVVVVSKKMLEELGEDKAKKFAANQVNPDLPYNPNNIKIVHASSAAISSLTGETIFADKDAASAITVKIENTEEVVGNGQKKSVLSSSSSKEVPTVKKTLLAAAMESELFAGPKSTPSPKTKRTLLADALQSKLEPVSERFRWNQVQTPASENANPKQDSPSVSGTRNRPSLPRSAHQTAASQADDDDDDDDDEEEDDDDEDDSSDSSFFCEECDKSYTTYLKLKLHKKIHNRERPFLCGLCDNSYSLHMDLECHLLNHSDATGNKTRVCFTCSVCVEEFDTEEEMEVHLQTHGEVDVETVYECGQCGKELNSHVHLKVHMKEHMNNDFEPCKCGICMKSFWDVAALKEHLSQRHFLNAHYMCDVCKCRFVTSGALKAHMPVHVQASDHKTNMNWKCRYCTKRYLNKGEMIIHIRLDHPMARFFDCSFCCSSFVNQEDLQAHVKTHSVVAHFL